MCNTKKLCTCGDDIDPDNNWVLTPSGSGQIIGGDPVMIDITTGDFPLDANIVIGDFGPKNGDISIAIGGVTGEEAFLNEGNPFDFDYSPKEGDKLVVTREGEEFYTAIHNGDEWRILLSITKNN